MVHVIAFWRWREPCDSTGTLPSERLVKYKLSDFNEEQSQEKLEDVKRMI